MHVEEDDAPALKKWIMKRLEDISDADSDVLADYVLALVKSDDPDDQVRANSLESLEDFLKDHTTKFVDDILQAIRTKSYDETYVQPSIEPPTGPSFNPPSGPSADSTRRSSLPGQGGQIGAQNGQSRKRNFNQTGLNDGQDGRDSHYSRGSGDRAFKQMRRGGARGGMVPTGPAMGNGRGGSKDSPMGGLGNMSRTSMDHAGSLPSMPTPPPGFPPLDPNNPLAAMMAMQAMGFPMPGFPGLPGQGSPGFGPSGSPTSSIPPKKVGQRCRDYDTKGFCALGTACPYEHGFDSIVVGQPEEYDPTKASPTTERPQNGYGHDRGRGDRGRGRGRGRGDRGGPGGKQRAAFSHAGPNHDKSNTTIVVEQIPEDKFDEQTVRDFFSEFGIITDIKMQAYKHLAIVQYEDYWAAKKAYDSPKVIFDNRFVKVYWYKPDSVPTQPTNGGHKADAESKPDEEMIDPAEFERKQAEAQKAHEEKQKRMEEAKNARQQLDKKLKAQAEERRLLLEKLAAKTGGKEASPATVQSPTTAAEPDEAKKSQTESLRAKLAELEAEAERIGLNPDDQQGTGYRGRGRGGYRGRGGFPPRGRGYDGYRGAPYRGRGAFAGANRGGVMRLDNRPKRIAVSGTDLTSPEKDEAFRQYLFNNFESINIEAHPDKKDTLVISFQERYLAENFINSTADIPQVGHVELTWHTGPPSALPTPTPSSAIKELGHADTAMGGDTNGAPTTTGEEVTKAEVDYDVADDEDQWMGS